MAGSWTKQNKVLPGAYINVATNTPLAITTGERGIVVILQELTTGEDARLYKITATEAEWPDGTTADDKKLANEALKKAKTVLVYKLPDEHTTEQVSAALAALKTQPFNTLCYPYDSTPTTAAACKTAIATWVKTMREEGLKYQAVLANYSGDSEGLINVAQGVILNDSTELTAAEVTAWVAGATAGANVATSNTMSKYEGAIDVVPRMTKTEMEEAIKSGKFIFKVDSSQNVTVVYDINSLTTITPDKSKIFTKNRVIRTIDGIANDVATIFESSYVGKISNNEDGRSIFKAVLVDYFNNLQARGAIQNFDVKDVAVKAGEASDAVIVNAYIQPVDSVEKIYITVNLS